MWNLQMKVIIMRVVQFMNICLNVKVVDMRRLSMNELKTLKDLVYHDWSLNMDEDRSFCKQGNTKLKEEVIVSDEWIDTDELRQEAIKWVKEIDNAIAVTPHPKPWIMKFFNLTLEDLK